MPSLAGEQQGPRGLSSSLVGSTRSIHFKLVLSLSEQMIPVASKAGGPETEDQAKLRFQVELEFVQCLGNPNYLNFLAQRGYFKDQPFINYLKYLLYWKEPEYVKYLKYPMCLYFLDLLQYEHFRREVVNAQCAKFIDDQQVLLWQHYTRRRTRMLTEPMPTSSVTSHALNTTTTTISSSTNGLPPATKNPS